MEMKSVFSSPARSVFIVKNEAESLAYAGFCTRSLFGREPVKGSPALRVAGCLRKGCMCFFKKNNEEQSCINETPTGKADVSAWTQKPGFTWRLIDLLFDACQIFLVLFYQLSVHRLSSQKSGPVPKACPLSVSDYTQSAHPDTSTQIHHALVFRGLRSREVWY